MKVEAKYDKEAEIHLNITFSNADEWLIFKNFIHEYDGEDIDFVEQIWEEIKHL